jgi:non-ribosomal peptide synthetase component F
LRALGVGREMLVGLYVERSLDMVIGLLGILKAGGAYLPIDPVYPRDRVAFMLDDAQAPVLLTQSRLADGLTASGPRMTVVCLDRDTDRAAIDRESAANPKSDAAAGDLAYVIYTSGSTGTPKGTLVTHRNVTRLMRRRKHGSGSTNATCGRCSTLTPSISASGSCGARSATAAAW